MKAFEAGRFSFSAQNKPYIMGILNVTPDSFSDGGRYFSLTDALKQTEKMIEDGADVIDVGAVSTRPFSEKVDEAEEWNRLKLIVPEIIKNFNIPVSVDTFTPAVAERCLYEGADIINDVSGIFMSQMADVIKRYNCGWVIMHGGVMLRRSEEEIEYSTSVVDDVNSFFSEMLDRIKEQGIEKNRICLDAGFGFSKNTAQNIELLESFDEIDNHGLLLLCALSRKRFIGEMSGEKDAEKRDNATLEANLKAIKKGADMIRVHNVRLHKCAITDI